MAIGFSMAPGDVYSDGISTVQVSMGISASTPKCYSFGEIKDGIVTITPIEETTSKGMNRSLLCKFEAKFKVLYTNKTNLIKMLYYFVLHYFDWIITMQSGVTFTSALMALPWIGCSFDFDSSKDFDGYRYVEFTLSRNMLYSDIATLTGSNSSVLAYATADATLALIANLAVTDLVPAGVTNFSLAPTGGALEPVGVFRNAKLSIKSLTEMDNLKRARIRGFEMATEVELMQSALTDIGISQTINIPIDHSLTLPDGMIFKSVNQQGISWGFNALKDAGDVAYVKLMGKGILNNASIATTWPALFT